MEISLERNSDSEGRPVYRQIAEHIRREVDSGQLAAGVRLPAIRDLARSLRVNRDTVALAYEELVRTGVVESSVGTGQPADAIVEYADTHDIDLIVMGTHGRGGVEKMWLGSVTEKVLRKAHCPVLALRDGA